MELWDILLGGVYTQGVYVGKAKLVTFADPSAKFTKTNTQCIR